MLFTSFSFWLFFLVAVLLCSQASGQVRILLLVVASLFFYATFNPLLVLLLVGFTVFNYFTGLALDRQGASKRVILAAAIVGDLSVLAFFKYYNFLVLSAAAVFGFPEQHFLLKIMLPVAVSFFTFEGISYNVDIYRGELKASRNFLDFALFISFFPHLTAGPIIRPSNFFPQVAAAARPTDADVRWGMLQILKGLIKKMVFADNLAPISTHFYDSLASSPDPLAAWGAVLAFGMQIYCDFAGYTDIARGCSRILGFDFPSNFERPYLAANIADFWRRWHISLSTWLRDYLYIPLGGSRKGTLRVYLNLLIVMGLGGLWHGASWNFLVWGLFHGVLLVIQRIFSGLVSRSKAFGWWNSAKLAPVQILFTFLLVNIGWILFRAPNFHASMVTMRALFSFSQMHFSTAGQTLFVPGLLLGICLAWCLVDPKRRLQHTLFEEGLLRFPVSVAASFFVLEIFAKTDIAVPFIYFRF